jgi:hypothetical protein
MHPADRRPACGPASPPHPRAEHAPQPVGRAGGAGTRRSRRCLRPSLRPASAAAIRPGAAARVPRPGRRGHAGRAPPRRSRGPDRRRPAQHWVVVAAGNSQGEVAGFLERYAAQFAIPIATDGLNLGIDHFLDALRGHPTRVALIGSEWPLSSTEGIAIVAVRPIPRFLWWVACRKDARHPQLGRFLGLLRERPVDGVQGHMHGLLVDQAVESPAISTGHLAPIVRTSHRHWWTRALQMVLQTPHAQRPLKVDGPHRYRPRTAWPAPLLGRG